MFSFLVTYYDQEDQLKRCLGSIGKFHPDSPIILSQETGEIPVEVDVEQHLFHNMKTHEWADACIKMFKACPTDIAVVMEHDCVLLKPVDELVEKLKDYDLVGVEEVYDTMRNSPGFANQNFFVINVKKFITTHGLESVKIQDKDKLTHLKNRESGYGITQHSKNIYWLPLKPSGYGRGTYYGDYVHHMWYGAYRQRSVESDGEDPGWLDDEAYRFLKDYDNGVVSKT